MNRSTLLGSGFIAIGLIVGGWLLGSQIKDVRLADRYVTVRGLAQQTVNADLAIWPLSFREAGNDLEATYAKSMKDDRAVLQFLTAQKIPAGDITQGQPGVTDTQATGYGGNRSPYRYIVEQSVTVRTHDVEGVAAAVQKASALIAKGVVLGGGPAYGPRNGVSYLYTQLNSIKPAMITTATHNARIAAQRFAADSGSRVG
ncbi:MAG: SIMPL domain-containing protein, partial [Terriglobales bacterium]